MILKKVKIYNYRQLQKVELDLQNSLTVLLLKNISENVTIKCRHAFWTLVIPIAKKKKQNFIL